MMNKKNTKQQKENLNFIKDWFKRRFNKEPEDDLKRDFEKNKKYFDNVKVCLINQD